MDQQSQHIALLPPAEFQTPPFQHPSQAGAPYPPLQHHPQSAAPYQVSQYYSDPQRPEHLPREYQIPPAPSNPPYSQAQLPPLSLSSRYPSQSPRTFSLAQPPHGNPEHGQSRPLSENVPPSFTSGQPQGYESRIQRGHSRSRSAQFSMRQRSHPYGPGGDATSSSQRRSYIDPSLSDLSNSASNPFTLQRSASYLGPSQTTPQSLRSSIPLDHRYPVLPRRGDQSQPYPQAHLPGQEPLAPPGPSQSDFLSRRESRSPSRQHRRTQSGRSIDLTSLSRISSTPNPLRTFDSTPADPGVIRLPPIQFPSNQQTRPLMQQPPVQIQPLQLPLPGMYGPASASTPSSAGNHSSSAQLSPTAQTQQAQSGQSRSSASQAQLNPSFLFPPSRPPSTTRPESPRKYH